MKKILWGGKIIKRIFFWQKILFFWDENNCEVKIIVRFILINKIIFLYRDKLAIIVYILIYKITK